MPFEMKEVFQYGVPTGLLVWILWAVVPWVRTWLERLLDTIDKGFAKADQSAGERTSAIKEAITTGFAGLEKIQRQQDNDTRAILTTIHGEDREDREKERELRHGMKEELHALNLQLQLEREDREAREREHVK